MADKPEQVNAWLDDEDGNRAADLILKPDDYTETVKLPGKKPGWMQRKHAYSAGGEELEGWDGPEVEESGNVSELQYTDEEIEHVTIAFPYSALQSRVTPEGFISEFINDYARNERLIGIGYTKDYNFTQYVESQFSDYESIYADDESETVFINFTIEREWWKVAMDTLAGFSTEDLRNIYVWNLSSQGYYYYYLCGMYHLKEILYTDDTGKTITYVISSADEIDNYSAISEYFLRGAWNLSIVEALKASKKVQFTIS